MIPVVKHKDRALSLCLTFGDVVKNFKTNANITLYSLTTYFQETIASHLNITQMTLMHEKKKYSWSVVNENKHHKLHLKMLFHVDGKNELYEHRSYEVDKKDESPSFGAIFKEDTVISLSLIMNK